MKITLSSRRHHYVKRVSTFLLVLALIAGMVSCGPTPIEIWDWYDLDAVRNNLSGSYILMNDLDSTTAGYTELASETANNGTGWQPIGIFWDDEFTGTFDGQGYKIKDLFINRPGENDVGLFAYVGAGGVIEDVGVVNADVTGFADVCGLVAVNCGTVSNCYSSGTVTGNASPVGGLVGVNGGPFVDTEEGTVIDCYSSANVFGQGLGTDDCAGGLVGMNGGPVSNSYSTGIVAGSVSVGGLVGINGADVSNSYSTSSVTGYSRIGGLVGWNLNPGTIISNSYSTGNVTGNSSVGGLVGENERGTVNNSYSTGNVTGDEYVGGLVGENDGSIVSNSFWDTETSGQDTSDGGTGKNTTEMQYITTFSGAAWDIVVVGGPGARNPAYIWNIVNNVTYPFLSWQS
jgi:hypothetical protein